MSVVIDQLRISDDGTIMHIDAHVNKADYFDDIYLDSITIMTADKVLETNPCEPTEDYIYKQVLEGNRKEIHIILTANDFIRNWETDAHSMQFKQADMSRTLFFVYFKVKGVPAPCTPCNCDKEITVGVTFDEKLLYQRVMDYTKSLADDCNIPVGFTDFILLWNAFKASVETDHWVPAIKYYNMLFGNNGVITPYSSKPCGCHG